MGNIGSEIIRQLEKSNIEGLAKKKVNFFVSVLKCKKERGFPFSNADTVETSGDLKSCIPGGHTDD